MTTPTDTQMLDWLEQQANEPDGILLHSGEKTTGRCGLGLRPGTMIRTLREAIAQAMPADGVPAPRVGEGTAGEALHAIVEWATDDVDACDGGRK